jgi:glucan phosphoethanolaminetransferase (alkaline phosphatase superfamily)
VLLAPLAEELASTDRPLFIGLHTFGSHWQYESRYPPEFARFGPTAGLSFLSAFAPGGDARVVNAYDNSIAYTDWFLGQIMDRLRRLEVPATLTYVADHGEDLMTLDGRAGHGVATFSRQQYDIPAFVWMNERFRATHPEVAAAVAQNATRLVRSHNVFYSLAELMGIGWPGARPESSFADARFVPDTTSPLIVGGALSTQTP